MKNGTGHPAGGEAKCKQWQHGNGSLGWRPLQLVIREAQEAERRGPSSQSGSRTQTPVGSRPVSNPGVTLQSHLEAHLGRHFDATSPTSSMGRPGSQSLLSSGKLSFGSAPLKMETQKLPPTRIIPMARGNYFATEYR